MFPRPTPVARRPCARCGIPTRLDRLVAGAYGSDCATLLGLTTTTPRLRSHAQAGPTLLDLLIGDDDDEPEDCCDGWDR
jgi:hypothetical protein